MHEVAPAGFDHRFPGHRLDKVSQKPLTAIGPFHQVGCDGHEKIAQLPIWP